MKILLLGEYSNVHNTLARGLRALGHNVTVVSGGDGWKDYPRDIDLRHQLTFTGHLSFVKRLMCALPRLRGYDVVQIINPVFFEMRAEPHHYLLDYICRNNGKLVLGAFGMDYYWVQVNRDLRPMRYSDFNIGDRPRTDAVAQEYIQTWVGTSAERLCRRAASMADAIVAGLYEYWITYRMAEGGTLAHKTRYIPFPVPMSQDEQDPEEKMMTCNRQEDEGKLKMFIGISRGRSQYKGTDIMLRAAKRLCNDYPRRTELLIAEGVPFAKYQQMMDGSDLILDQLYGYTPAMNALLAMSKGIICVGGGEEEHYELLGEEELRPVVNVEPSEQSVYAALEHLIVHPELIPTLKQQSREYVCRHHDVMRVAKVYEALYRSLL